MRIDLHAHSTASDGTDTAAQLMAAAAAAGLDTVAITDHDTTGGWAEAAAARPDGLAVVRGAEFSAAVPYDGRRISVHLLGYLFDPDDAGIRDEQARLREERRTRGEAIVARMVAGGLPISMEQVRDIAQDAPIGRPHIGRALVDAGVVDSVTDAFATLLSSRGSYYVPKQDTDLLAAIELVAAAGGVSVIAHPRGRGEQLVLTEPCLVDLAAAGLGGLEVDHPIHDAAARAELREIADRLGLLATGSSDYHGTNKTVRLGQESTCPEVLDQIVDRGRLPLLAGPVPAQLS